MSSFGAHQDLLDLHKIMTPIPSASSHLPQQSVKSRSVECGEVELFMQQPPCDTEPKGNHHAQPAEMASLRRIVTNGGWSYPPKQCKISSSKSCVAFGESLKNLKHMDDTSSSTSSTMLNHNNDLKDLQGDRHLVPSSDANLPPTKRAGVSTISARSSSTPTFPEFTEKLTEASEFVKKNPARRRNNQDQAGKRNIRIHIY